MRIAEYKVSRSSSPLDPKAHTHQLSILQHESRHTIPCERKDGRRLGRKRGKRRRCRRGGKDSDMKREKFLMGKTSGDVGRSWRRGGKGREARREKEGEGGKKEGKEVRK